MSLLTIVMAMSLAQASDEFRWVHSPTDPERLYLYRFGKQVGGYDLAEHFYRPFDGSRWGERTESPLPPPCFGVSAKKIGAAPAYRINGEPVSPKVAYEAVEKGFEDDSRKLRVTFIGPAEVRAKARAEFEKHPDFAGLKGDWAIRDFPPEHWAMQAGFVTAGQPTIYCQTPEGQVLHRQDDFAGGAESLVAALRRAKQSYDPRRDPDLRSTLAGLRPYATVAIAGAVGVGVVLLRRFVRV